MIIWKEEENVNKLMEVGILGNELRIIEKVMESFFIISDNNTMDNGRMIIFKE